MNKQIGFILAIFLISASVARADERSSSLRDVSVIQNSEGAARVLFRMGGTDAMDRIAISSAMLTFPATGAVQERDIELCLHPVTRSWDPGTVDWYSGWSRPGGDFDEELVSATRLDLRRPVSDVVFDVTAIVKEVMEAGMQADGFVLTVSATHGDGLDASDLLRFGDMSGASLELRYRNVAAPPIASR